MDRIHSFNCDSFMADRMGLDGTMLHYLAVRKAMVSVHRPVHSKITLTYSLTSLASHTLCREEGSGHAATIELSPRQKLDVTNQIRMTQKLWHPWILRQRGGGRVLIHGWSMDGQIK